MFYEVVGTFASPIRTFLTMKHDKHTHIIKLNSHHRTIIINLFTLIEELLEQADLGRYQAVSFFISCIPQSCLMTAYVLIYTIFHEYWS